MAHRPPSYTHPIEQLHTDVNLKEFTMIMGEQEGISTQKTETLLRTIKKRERSQPNNSTS